MKLKIECIVESNAQAIDVMRDIIRYLVKLEIEG